MEKSKIRKPVVSGQFYPAAAGEVAKLIEKFLVPSLKKDDCIACMLPHAGYIYSGRVAVETVSRINIKDTIILLGPNHTGNGSDFSIETEGVWETPLGSVTINTALAREILKAGEQYFEEDSLAHLNEHSLEVELPILQYFKKSFQIVPVTVMSDKLADLKEAGKAIAVAVKSSGLQSSVLIVASSDMTHYEPEEQAKTKDTRAIEAILALDEDRLTEEVDGLNISMCGYAPVCMMLVCAKLLGAKKGELIKYQTSGDSTGDTSSVVGYAGITIH
ncbi:MAG: AmmeMemoRadiSam system protein B [Candidatus Omnitrophica bacterium]|jgi:hypothetical protein|nr:AmmeMemoRadiSam system protein B [Candidatus Omnitrophota bacterium]